MSVSGFVFFEAHDLHPHFISSEQWIRGPWLFVGNIGDEILRSFEGIISINHEIRIPFLNNQDSMDRVVFFRGSSGFNQNDRPKCWKLQYSKRTFLIPVFRVFVGNYHLKSPKSCSVSFIGISLILGKPVCGNQSVLYSVNIYQYSVHRYMLIHP